MWRSTNEVLGASNDAWYQQHLGERALAREFGHDFLDATAISRELLHHARACTQWDLNHFYPAMYNHWLNLLLTRMCRACGAHQQPAVAERNAQFCVPLDPRPADSKPHPRR
ncbi:MAG: hypothetical protein P4L83_11965 [Nevskia sp.]|nr:hypothetical protein [Nevskia sp.]